MLNHCTSKSIFFGFFILSVFLISCKSSKVARNSGSANGSQQVLEPKEPDSVFLITTLGDTLSSLNQEIWIKADTIEKGSLNILAVGDLMIGTDFPNTSYLPDSSLYLLSELDSIREDKTLLFGNLEGVILDGEGTPKKCKNMDLCYIFKTPTKFATQFKHSNFDVMSTANNHANDFGLKGTKGTCRFLDSLNIAHAGLVAQPYTIFKKNQFRIGFTAFAPNYGTNSIHDYQNAVKIIQHLDSLSDIIIVSMHAGAEGKKHEHITKKTEKFYGENRGNVYQFARLMIDTGADMIIGHGPHVPRAIDLYKDRVIAYSLGNFCTYGRFNLKGSNAYAPAISIKLKSNGSFHSGEIISFLQKGRGIPVFDPNHTAAKKIKSLTQEDLPESPIQISEEGKITKTEK